MPHNLLLSKWERHRFDRHSSHIQRVVLHGLMVSSGEQGQADPSSITVGTGPATHLCQGHGQWDQSTPSKSADNKLCGVMDTLQEGDVTQRDLGQA